MVAGAVSAVLFCGLGAGMAANEDTGSDSSWAATPGSSSGQSVMTSSQGS